MITRRPLRNLYFINILPAMVFRCADSTLQIPNFLKA
jgi:hypothetical protein